MEVVYPICCGIDVHHARLTACLRRVQEDGQVAKDVREFDTTYTALLVLSEWLQEAHCPVVAMESPGVYWRPVYHVLVGTVDVLVGNPQEMRRRPGHKTDKADARWIAEWLAHGLIRPSFIPPPGHPGVAGSDPHAGGPDPDPHPSQEPGDQGVGGYQHQDRPCRV